MLDNEAKHDESDDKSAPEKLAEVREEMETVAQYDIPIQEDLEKLLAALDQEGLR